MLGARRNCADLQGEDQQNQHDQARGTAQAGKQSAGNDRIHPRTLHNAKAVMIFHQDWSALVVSKSSVEHVACEQDNAKRMQGPEVLLQPGRSNTNQLIQNPCRNVRNGSEAAGQFPLAPPALT